jgi:hypothetical protein
VVTWDAGSEVGKIGRAGGDGRKDRPGRGPLFKETSELGEATGCG